MIKKLMLGTVQFGLNYGINNSVGKVSQKEVGKILHECTENKINYFDTSSAYGDSEIVLGSILNSTNLKMNIVSKYVSNDTSNDVKLCFDKSLSNLQQNSIYGYLIHYFKDFLAKPEIWNDFEALKKSGKVRKIGFSLYSPFELEKIFSDKINFDLIQVPYSIFDRRFEKYFEKLNAMGVEIHTRSVFLQGLVFKNPETLSENFGKFPGKLKKFQEMSTYYNIPVSALCLNFSFLNNNIDKILIGVDSLDQLKNNFNDILQFQKVMSISHLLNEFEETDEKIILPVNWK